MPPTTCTHRLILDPLTMERYCTHCGMVDPIPVLFEATPRMGISGFEVPSGYGPAQRHITPLPLRSGGQYDGAGKRLNATQWWRYKVLSYMDHRGTYPSQIQAQYGLVQFEQRGAQLDLPQPISEMAHQIYTKWRKQSTWSAPCDPTQAAAFLVATRLHGIYLSHRTVCNVCHHAKISSMWRVFRSMIRDYGNRLTVEPETIVLTVARKLNLKHETRIEATQLLSRHADNAEVRKCMPRILAAGAIYYALLHTHDGTITQEQITAAVGCSFAGMRRAYRLFIRLETTATGQATEGTSATGTS